MRKRTRATQHGNHERWLVSYADFITLLFAFFVVMFASSQTDKGRAKQVSESVQKAFNQSVSKDAMTVLARVLGGTPDQAGQGNAMMRGPGGTKKQLTEPPDPVVELLPSVQKLSKELEREIRDGKLEVNLQPRGLVISLRQAAFFPSGGDLIDETALPVLEKLAKVIRSVENQIRLEGHTDSIPIRNSRFDSNWELSAARSIAMLRILTADFELPEKRFAVAGYADTAPLGANDTPEGRMRNRRVDIVILNYAAKREEPAAGKAAASRSFSRNGTDMQDK